jgi:hypothetical protein
MPTHERLGPDDRDDLLDRRKPPIQLDEEPPIVVGKECPAWLLTPQDSQLMSERHILRFKPALRLERRDHDGQHKAK